MDQSEEEAYLSLIFGSDDAIMDPSPQEVEEQSARILIRPDPRPSVPDRPSKFMARLCRFLHHLQNEGAISILNGEYHCVICHSVFSSLTDISRHCWQQHQTFVPPSLKPFACFFYSDLPSDFTREQLAAASQISIRECFEDRLTLSDFSKTEIEIRTNSFDFTFILGVLGPQFQLKETDETQIVLLNLPMAFPISIQRQSDVIILGFSDTTKASAAEILRLYREAVTVITSNYLLVAKYTDVSPSAVSDDVISKIKERFSAVIVKSGYSEDECMKSCDVTLTILTPRKGEMNSKLAKKLKKMATKGDIKLCRKCYRFFGLDQLGNCTSQPKHAPFGNQYTKVVIYPRPFAEGSGPTSS
jgi:hypothetical protein